MTEREYRQDDETRGFCPTCGRELAALDVAGRGICEEHGRVFADWRSEDAPDTCATRPEKARAMPSSGHQSVEFTDKQMKALLVAIASYLDDWDDLLAGERRALAVAEKRIRQAREHLLDKRIKAGLR